MKIKSNFRSVVLVLTVLMAGVLCAQTTYYVSPHGDNSDGLTWGTAKQTIAGGLALAVNAGDEVVITNGTYQPAAQLAINKAITVRSHENDPDTVLIDGGSMGGAVPMFNMTADALLAGLTVTNGNVGGYTCAGLEMTQGTVSNCVFANNTARYRAGINMSGGRVTHSWFRNNTASGVTASSGGGMGIAGGGVVADCTFEGNYAGGHGGGIYHDGADPLLVSNCVFTANTCGAAGGGGIHSVSNLTVVDSLFTANSSNPNGSGSGLLMKGDGMALRCDFIQNAMISGTGSRRGAGAYIADLAVIDSCTFVSNSARYGGTIYMTGGMVRNSSIRYSEGQHGAGIYMTAGTLESTEVLDSTYSGIGMYGAVHLAGEGVISNVTVVGNSVSDCGGVYMTGGLLVDSTIISNAAPRSHNGNQGAGGVFMTGGVAERNLIAYNTSVHNNSTGGARISGANTVMRNSLIIGNQTQTRAGGVRLDNGGQIVNCTVIGNKLNTATYGGGITFEATGGTVSNSIVLFNSTTGSASNYYAVAPAVPVFGYSVTMPLPDGDGNWAVDPELVDRGSGTGLGHVFGDYQLQKTSPCVDKGQDDESWMNDSLCYYGFARVFGTHVDIGAHEFTSVLSGTIFIFK